MTATPTRDGEEGELNKGERNLRDLSWRLRCSLRLKARLQNWHLYFFSGAPVALRVVEGVLVAGTMGISEAGIVLWESGGRKRSRTSLRGAGVYCWRSEDATAGRKRVGVKVGDG